MNPENGCSYVNWWEKRVERYLLFRSLEKATSKVPWNRLDREDGDAGRKTDENGLDLAKE